MTRRLDWADLRSDEFARLDPDTTIAILPTAAIEQHGPHLPVGTDTMIAQGMLDELRRSCPEDLDILILPIQAVGKSNEHLYAPGTVTHDAETTIAAWRNIGLSVARAGLRKMVIVNSHGGNMDVNSIVARDLRVQAGMYVVKCAWGAFGYPEGMFSNRELTYGLHGGDIETSLMLDFRPDTVDMAHAQDFGSTHETDPIPPVGPVSYGWIASDLNPDGVVGEAHLATAAKGRATCEHQVQGFIQMLRQMRDTDLSRFTSSG